MRAFKVLFLFLIIFLIGLDVLSEEEHTMLYKLNSSIPKVNFAPDTIYQIDTVYQYEIIYDTLYYFDSIPQTDTLVVHETFIEDNDTTVIVNKIVNYKVIESKRVFKSENQKVLNNSLREFGNPDAAASTEYNAELSDQSEITKAETSSTSQVNNASSTEREFLFTHSPRDTLYRWDTIVSFQTRFDTVVFETNSRSDTSSSHHIEYEKYGRTVVAKEIVNLKVVRKENLFVERIPQNSNNKDANKNNTKANRTIKSSSLDNSRSRRDMKNSMRSFQNGKSSSYSSYLRFGVGFFDPEITFSAENQESEDYVEGMNENTQSEPSYSVSFTYNYFKNRWGFETGIGLSKQKFNCKHQVQLADIDTTFYWEYFEEEDYLYDTTWYINIDTLLQTGDTLLMPNVDSTMIWVTDSTMAEKFDTTFYTQQGRSNFSFSYLEIPIIGHYSIVENRFFLRVAVGVIPTFLIAKSGNIVLSEEGGISDVNDISFDYGFSLSVYGSFVVGYSFTDKWALFAEPYIKRNLFSAMHNDNFLMKTNAWGVKVGVSYRLFSFTE